jgi:SAM-dependent methyltransferase
MGEDPSLFDRAYYESNYKHYLRQNPEYKMEFYRGLVSEHTPGIEQPRILDMGCAFGRFLGHMDASWHRVGIDISEYAVREATRSVSFVSFAVASCTAIPFRGPFHAIVAAFVNSELDRRGVFVFVVPVYDGPLGGIVRRLDKDPTHVHKNSRQFWLAWARQHFELTSWTGIFRYLLPQGTYINWPTRTLRGIAPAIAVAVRRRGEITQQTSTA